MNQLLNFNLVAWAGSRERSGTRQGDRAYPVRLLA